MIKMIPKQFASGFLDFGYYSVSAKTVIQIKRNPHMYFLTNKI